MLLATVVKGGKTQVNGRAGYTGSIRHRDPLQCPHGALGRYLISRFTLGGEMFPQPRDKQRYHSTPLWCGNRPDQSLSYSGHAAALSRWLGLCAIVSSKVTHLFRVAGARALDEAGMDDQVQLVAGSHRCMSFLVCMLVDTDALLLNMCTHDPQCISLLSGDWAHGPMAASGHVQVVLAVFSAGGTVGSGRLARCSNARLWPVFCRALLCQGRAALPATAVPLCARVCTDGKHCHLSLHPFLMPSH